MWCCGVGCERRGWNLIVKCSGDPIIHMWNSMYIFYYLDWYRPTLGTSTCCCRSFELVPQYRCARCLFAYGECTLDKTSSILEMLRRARATRFSALPPPEPSNIIFPYFRTHGDRIHVLTCTQRTRICFCPQHWLLCHLDLCSFEFEFGERVKVPLSRIESNRVLELLLRWSAPDPRSSGYT